MSKSILFFCCMMFSIFSFSHDEILDKIQQKKMLGDTTATPCSKTYCNCSPDGGDNKNCAADSKTAVNCENYCSAAYGGDSEDSCTLSACECTGSSYTTVDSKSCSITTPGPQQTPVTYESNCGKFCCQYWGGCS
jgi:hypothetical protein